MVTIRNGLHRRLFVAATAFLAGTATLGCQHGGGADTADRPAQRPPNNPNVLERHELNENATSVVELIEGRLPGVLVRRLGADISVQIRGQGSIRSSNEALIMIDGVESSGRALNNVNPKDVERIEVIKDGTAAMYGMRGANGVLLITTRRR